MVNEVIDIQKFLQCLKNNLETNDYVKSPKYASPLYNIEMDENKNIVGIKINHEQIYLSESWSDEDKYILKASDWLISEKNTFIHHSFSFDFRSNSDDSLIRKFRIDYKPLPQYPDEHAHDDGYNQTNTNHLLYKKDVLLYIFYADINTILTILRTYIEHPDKYPLDNQYSDLYNTLIVNERKKYDEAV